MAKEKIIKCYFCGSVVEMSNQLVEKKIPMTTKAGIRNYRRQFHLECLPKYVEGLEDKELLSEENSDWDAVYQYFRNDILGLPNTVPLDPHATKRLLGLRLGTYYPRGNNTRILPRGYDFKTILVCLKVIKAKVHVYMASTTFVDNKHRIDGIMRFVTGEINDVYKRMELQRKSNEKLVNQTPIEITPKGFDYLEELKKKKKIESASTSDNINKLFGGL